MRYFWSIENSKIRGARYYLACGIISFSLSTLIEFFFDEITVFVLLFDLIGCLLLFFGLLIIDGGKLTKKSILIATALAVRLCLVLTDRWGVFTFLLDLSFTLLVLFGEIFVLEGYAAKLNYYGDEKKATILGRLINALARSEICLWCVFIISYVSSLLAFPALLLMLWSVLVRMGCSFLVFKKVNCSKPLFEFARKRFLHH